MAVLFYMSCFSCLVPAVLSILSSLGWLILVIFSWQPCSPGVFSASLVMPVQFCLSSFACPVLPVQFWLSDSGCPVLPITFFSSCPLLYISPLCIILAVLNWRPYSGSPVPDVLPSQSCCLSCSGCPFPDVSSSCLFLAGCRTLATRSVRPLLPVLFWMSFYACSVLSVLFCLSCFCFSVLPVLFPVLWSRSWSPVYWSVDSGSGSN